MMKIAGHTMGTPEYALKDAVRLFRQMGLDGIEIIVASDGYPCAIAQDADDRTVDKVGELARAAGLEVAGLTPYLNLFNSLDEAVRERECAQLRRVIDMAAMLGAASVRVYGGKFVDGETDGDGRKLDALVRSMRACGDHAAARGVVLSLENHFGTMTTTARETSRIVRLIDHDSVGILYDQANLAFFPAEEYEEAIELQKDKIFFVHCKDLVYRGGSPRRPVFANVSHIDEAERTVHSRVPGDGILDWPGILKALRGVGYDGWLSLEYERRWQQIDLPDASVGMPRGAQFIRGILREMENRP